MGFVMEAACGCHMGKRRNNEDNFFFDEKCLDMENTGLAETLICKSQLKGGVFQMVFDGVGGEAMGEAASFSAASRLKNQRKTALKHFVPAKKIIEKVLMELNTAVVEAQKKYKAEHMATTIVGLYFNSKQVYSYNMGDSRAYRLRDNQLEQISFDHTANYLCREGKKAPITRYLGMDPEEMVIEAYMEKHKLRRGDMFLLCSDGLTDMLTAVEIFDIMQKSDDAGSCVEHLIQAALERGGRDNITVIVSIII